MKYKYKYCVYANNLKWGFYFIESYDTKREAEAAKRTFEHGSKWGCCDVVKKRFYI